MDKKTKILLIFLASACCFICYSCYEWYYYKHKYNELKQELKCESRKLESLSPIDCMVLSGDTAAYEKCNSMYFIRCDDTPILERDYLLYCYIFAIRDKNPYAGAEFLDLYLDDLENGKIESDTAMLTTVANMAKKVLSDTCSDCLVSKYFAADCLKKIYSGIYIENFKDTALASQYADSTSKYMNQRWP